MTPKTARLTIRLTAVERGKLAELAGDDQSLASVARRLMALGLQANPQREKRGGTR